MRLYPSSSPAKGTPFNCLGTGRTVGQAACSHSQTKPSSPGGGGSSEEGESRAPAPVSLRQSQISVAQQVSMGHRV